MEPLTHTNKRPSSDGESSSSKRQQQGVPPSSSSFAIGASNSPPGPSTPTFFNIRYSPPSTVAAMTTHNNNHRHQLAPPTNSTTIGFEPSLSDHPLEERSDGDDQWTDDDDADEILQADDGDVLSDTSLAPSASISQRSGTVRKVPSKHQASCCSFVPIFPSIKHAKY